MNMKTMWNHWVQSQWKKKTSMKSSCDACLLGGRLPQRAGKKINQTKCAPHDAKQHFQQISKLLVQEDLSCCAWCNVELQPQRLQSVVVTSSRIQQRHVLDAGVTDHCGGGNLQNFQGCIQTSRTYSEKITCPEHGHWPFQAISIQRSKNNNYPMIPQEAPLPCGRLI